MIRPFLLFTIVIVCFSCKTDKKIEKPQWLIGQWQRINTADTTKVMYETWNNDFTGTSFTSKDGDIIFNETIAIIENNNEKYFQITGINGQPSFFKFTEETSTSFTCENPQNQFPKKITYFFKENILHSKINNNDFEIEFLFKKIQTE